VGVESSHEKTYTNTQNKNMKHFAAMTGFKEVERRINDRN
jgi:hypothetical protein